MSDWAVGDLAVCADSPTSGLWHRRNGTHERGPHTGWAGTVVFVRDAGPFTFLVFAEWATEGYHAKSFRKIRPDEPKACEEEFQTLLDRSKVTAFDMMGGNE